MVGDMDQSPRPSGVDAGAAGPSSRAAHEYLRQLAIAELHDVRGILTETGQELEAAHARYRALARELDATLRDRSEVHDELNDTRSQLHATQDELSGSVAELSKSRSDAKQAARESAATLEAQRDHITRLKMQIQRPWRLLAKWFLRRGPYSRASSNRGG